MKGRRRSVRPFCFFPSVFLLMAALGFCPKRRTRECESQAGVAAKEFFAGDCYQRAAVFIVRLLRRRFAGFLSFSCVLFRDSICFRLLGYLVVASI